MIGFTSPESPGPLREAHSLIPTPLLSLLDESSPPCSLACIKPRRPQPRNKRASANAAIIPAQ